jgi:hypothetical protein
MELQIFIFKLIDVNTSLGLIKYTQVIIPVLFGIYILFINQGRRTIKFPHILPFSMMVIFFLFAEQFHSSQDIVHEFDGYKPFFWYQVRIYLFFIMLVNFGLNRSVFYKVIDYAFYSGLIICVITYVGYFGLIKVSNSGAVNQFSSSLMFTGNYRPGHVLHVNRVSFLLSYTILMLIIKQLHEKKFSNKMIARDFGLIILFFGIIVINASRGASIISILLVSYYTYYLWKRRFLNILARLSLFIAILGFVGYLLFTTNLERDIQLLSNKSNLANRFQRDLSEEAFGNLLRVVNMQNSWHNFTDNPILGVGYFNAAKYANTGSRSNNQYLQMLASYGIIFFIIYLFYNYKLVIYNHHLFKQPEVFLCFLYSSLHIVFRVPTERMSIIALIAIFFYYNFKNKNSVKHQISYEST